MISYAFIRPVLHRLPPETAHALAIYALKRRWLPSASASRHAALAVKAWGLHFDNPVGMAAGFDKNAEVVDALLTQGFGFVEAGTVTPRPQEGNPAPRLFRLREDEAVINRLGFNSEGVETFTRNLQNHMPGRGVVGANIGRNRDCEDAVADYVLLLERVSPYCDYVTVNISSPNTQGLRSMQHRRSLSALCAALARKRAEMRECGAKAPPVLLKIAPDLEPHALEDVVEVALEERVDGLVVSNTTIRRPATLRSAAHGEQGGLSGRPLFELSTQMLRDAYRLTRGRLPLIGVGGIASAADAYAKIRAGATLVQLYTALVYQGFGLVPRLCDELASLLVRDGFAGVQDAVGADVRL